MVLMRRRLACCTRDREISIDFDENEKITTYDGLESCILNSQPYDNQSVTSRGDGGITDSLDDDDSSSSSSNNVFGSFSSHWTTMKRDDEWDFSASPQHYYVKEKPAYATQFSDVETMKEKFAKLLLGEDVTGGSKGISTALALSNAITNLAASVFGELWKLEPLAEDRKRKWKREMDWLLSPTNHMIELVPAKQNGSNGQKLEIMTPKARADIHMNLPALQKLDSMLLEALDSMVNTEFWYMEVGSRAEGRSRGAGQSKRWWLPSPQVPISGLSDPERDKLLNQGKLVNQIFKAAKAINENVLSEMPVPTIITDALPKSGRTSLGEELYRILSAESTSVEAMFVALNIRSEHNALEAVNRLEAAILAWKEKIAEHAGGKSPARTSWSFIKDPISELDKVEVLLSRAETLLLQLKIKYPNLPQTFLNVTKIQYGKDVGRSILEAYSRVLLNLAFCILTRIGEILQEDNLSNPNSPAAACHLPGIRILGLSDSPIPSRVRHSLIDQMNKTDERSCDSRHTNASDIDIESAELKISSVTATPSRSRVWCIGREACSSMSAANSP
ncbi:rop guanine nucleotide exchange factor 14 [Nicotiana sylvestris]|uniref:Rop guanine nucleotide exchange factor 14 n=2 Tax=Nicotiana TaxID=4085 RepID=A0A1S4CTJ8_TOBAC|nr:PREDICTED: rop guanine nucleotide exchange factor 14 [Nicotiana sylvestris]XP_009785256.1 PREDICTED: rop guanine nucleotide exchange factor 14 [Nicotiana sylvestris]XP_009785257.1 PREDICTED: rop guanine nucleotide exchange factor 14 [Nicotiana sylvestris]XP_016504442.1 PREDICTED: rop guanine nucleotide exchange factor 14-like [Nicotiana tabacum]XP_016504443.1 PREDICTED: rop guanine nucleotide exchange factor 14-like [Nicotiana tabacum]XP_016504444.1 PREDICTED: rop guanine nucleotide exchang